MYSELIEKLKGVLPDDFQGVSFRQCYMPQVKMWGRLHRQHMVNAQNWFNPKLDESRALEAKEAKVHRVIMTENPTTSYYKNGQIQLSRILSQSIVSVEMSDKMVSYVFGSSIKGKTFYNYVSGDYSEFVTDHPNGFTFAFSPEYAQKNNTDLFRHVEHTEVVYIDNDLFIFLDVEKSDIKRSEMSSITIDQEPFYPENYKLSEHVDTYGRIVTFNVTKAEYIIYYKDAVYRMYTSDFEKNGIKERKLFVDLLYTQIGKPYVQNKGFRVHDYPFTYQSFMSLGESFARSAQDLSSDFMASQKIYGVPRVSMLYTDCPSCTVLGAKHDEECGTCKGAKKVVNLSPYNVFIKKQRDSNTDPEHKYEPPIEFHNPEVDPLEFMQKMVSFYLEKYKESIYLIRRKEGNDTESYKALQESTKPILDFLEIVSDTLFGNIEVLLKAIAYHISPNDTDVRIIRPISLMVMSEGEALETLTKMLSAEVPTILKQSQIKDFINRYIGEKSSIAKLVSALEQVDELFYETESQKLLLCTGSEAIYDKAQYLKSRKLTKIAVQYVKENGDKTVDEIKEYLINNI